MPNPNLQTTASRALIQIDQLLAGLRENDQNSIDHTRRLLGHFVETSDGPQLAVLLTAVKARAEFCVREGT